MLVGLAGFAFYRYRVRRLIELERVRTRIATDLHDEKGSNLSLIAMVSEIAQQQINQDRTSVTDQLSLVARTSRQSVDAMSDIVWAVNPKRDHLHRQPAFDGMNLWVPSGNNVTGQITVIRASTGAVLATLIGNGVQRPETAAFDGERVLVTILSGNSVSLWRATSLTPIGTFAMPNGSEPIGALQRRPAVPDSA